MEKRSRPTSLTAYLGEYLLRFRTLLTLGVGIVTVVYSGFSLSSYYHDEQEKKREVEVRMIEAERSMRMSSDLQRQMTELRNGIDRLTAESGAVGASSSGSKGTPSGGASASEVAALRSDVSDLRNEVKSFEIALGDDPAKKMGVVMLRRDMDSLTESDKTQIAAVKDQLVAARDDDKSNLETVKWLLGLIGISNIVAPLVGAFLGRKSEPGKAV
jgi:hypothetical protein